MEVTTRQMEYLPWPPSTRPDFAFAFGEAAHDRAEEGQGGIGHRLGENIRGMTQSNATLLAGGDIDVVHAYSHLGDDFQMRGAIEDLGVDLIGEHAEEPAGSGYLLQESLAGHRALSLPQSQPITGETLQVVVGDPLRHVYAIHRQRG